MKYLLLSLALASSLALAEPFRSQTGIVCDETAIVFEIMDKKYEEKPIMISKDAKTDSQLAIMANLKKDTWTLVQFNNEHACVIAAGVNIKLMLENLGNGV